jgi:hypothetical protein
MRKRKKKEKERREEGGEGPMWPSAAGWLAKKLGDRGGERRGKEKKSWPNKRREPRRYGKIWRSHQCQSSLSRREAKITSKMKGEVGIVPGQ